jgi:hypothetical protein
MVVCLKPDTFQPPVHSKTLQHLGSSRFFEGVHVAHLCSFLCCVFFVLLLLVLCNMPNDDFVSEFVILDFRFGFL